MVRRNLGNLLLQRVKTQESWIWSVKIEPDLCMLQTGYCWVNLMIYREIWVISWKGPIWLLLLILLRDRKMLYYIFAYMSILLLRSCDLNLHITSCELWCSLDCKFHGSILLFEKPDLVLMIFFLKRNKWFILLKYHESHTY